jgi:hypothetical protein
VKLAKYGVGAFATKGIAALDLIGGAYHLVVAIPSAFDVFFFDRIYGRRSRDRGLAQFVSFLQAFSHYFVR